MNSQIQDTGEGPADPRFHSLREQSKEVSNEARGGLVIHPDFHGAAL